MTGEGGELSVQAHFDPRRWWLIVPLEVAGRSINMVLDTGSPLSSVSQGTYDKLADTGAIDHLGALRYALRSLTIQGQPIADLEVHVSRRVTQVGADGVLGLDFLGRFTEVYFHVPSLRLILK